MIQESTMKVLAVPMTFILVCFINNVLLGQTENESAIKVITAISKARADAFNDMDAKKISFYFSEDAVLLAPGKPVTFGKEAVRKYYQSIFDSYRVTLESHYEDVRIEGNMAYGRGEATVRLVPIKGGDSTVSKSKYLNILYRQPDGTWKTTHDIWNSNE